MAYAAEFFRWYAEEGVRIPGEFMTAPGRGNRIIIDYEPIGIAVLITPWKALKVGPGTAPDIDCGPMITRKAVNKIESLVAEAVGRGAEIVLGGTALDQPGYFYPPTVSSARAEIYPR